MVPPVAHVPTPFRSPNLSSVSEVSVTFSLPRFVTRIVYSTDPEMVPVLVNVQTVVCPLFTAMPLIWGSVACFVPVGTLSIAQETLVKFQLLGRVSVNE